MTSIRDRLEKEITLRMGQIDELRAALIEYAHHKQSCSINKWPFAKCNCGLEEIIQKYA